MELNTAVNALGALAHRHRLMVFRLLVQSGPNGLPAGDIAKNIGIPKNTLSTHLAALTRAGLLNSERLGRSIRYRIDFSGTLSLLRYLVEDCCRADPAQFPTSLEQVLTQCCAVPTSQEQTS